MVATAFSKPATVTEMSNKHVIVQMDTVDYTARLKPCHVAISFATMVRHGSLSTYPMARRSIIVIVGLHFQLQAKDMPECFVSMKKQCPVVVLCMTWNLGSLRQ